MEQSPLLPSTPLEPDDEQIEAILNIVARHTGQQFLDSYKHTCLKRKVIARLRRLDCPDIYSYMQVLNEDQHESERLISSIFIHVSRFFRNPGMFDLLQTSILPKLIKSKSDGRLRCWSIGCSAGEEPYSLAIILLESFPDLVEQQRFDILATDSDSKTLALAEKGIYNQDALCEVSDTRLQRFFVRQNNLYELKSDVRGLVNFKLMDLQQFERYPQSDLILCRNILIYFNRETQEKILHLLADILSFNGILVLGKSESLPSALRCKYLTVDPVERIYRCRRGGN